MHYTHYLVHDIRRTFRDRKFFLFSLAIPLVLYYVMTAGHNHDTVNGIPATAYYMVSLAVWGAVTAAVASGSRIAAERDAGWHRQLRLSALGTGRYLTAKTITAYLLALPTLGALLGAGAGAGVTMSAGNWAGTAALMLACLAPFTLLGVLAGLTLPSDTMAAALVGVMVTVGLLGGVWTPIDTYPGWLQSACRSLPSYWITHAGQQAFTGSTVNLQGGLVLAGWTTALAVASLLAWRRCTAAR